MVVVVIGGDGILSKHALARVAGRCAHGDGIGSGRPGRLRRPAEVGSIVPRRVLLGRVSAVFAVGRVGGAGVLKVNDIGGLHKKNIFINKCQGPALALCRLCPSTWRTPPKGFWTIHRLEVVHRLAILACSSVWSCWDCTERLSCRDPGPQSRRQQTGAALGRHCSLQMLRGFCARSDARWKPLRGHLPTPGRDARESLGMSIFPCLDGKPPGPHGQPQRTLQTLLLLDGRDLADTWDVHTVPASPS